ncbi:MAG: GIY-YIG nuclease family protein [Firmicutes bacterium]|nr:GIY-YIG nuclease family protein [Bacillota bacterium]
MKPDMGILAIKHNGKNKYYLEGTQYLRSTTNSTKFKLNFGNHPNRQLQKDWQKDGKESFTIEVLEKLKYDEDETKTDYSEELAILKILWEEKLLQQGARLY